MPPQPVILESQNATSVADGATIERRIRVSQPDEGRGRCHRNANRCVGQIGDAFPRLDWFKVREMKDIVDPSGQVARKELVVALDQYPTILVTVRTRESRTRPRAYRNE
jgi:hypothetical protein